MFNFDADSVPARPPHIPVQLENLDKSVARLSETIDILIKRLSSVSNNSPVVVPQENEQKQLRGGVEVADHLIAIRESIDLLWERSNRALNILEV